MATFIWSDGSEHSVPDPNWKGVPANLVAPPSTMEKLLNALPFQRHVEMVAILQEFGGSIDVGTLEGSRR